MKILRRRETNREIASGHFFISVQEFLNLTKRNAFFFFFRERIIPKFFYLHEIDRPVSKILWQLDQTF